MAKESEEFSPDPSKDFFSPECTDRERAVFEAGIKLGAMYHLISSFPVKKDETVIRALEEALAASIGSQPFVEKIQVHFDRDRLFKTGQPPFDYGEISGRVLEASVIVKYRQELVTARIQYVESLDYPLMFIESLETD